MCAADPVRKLGGVDPDLPREEAIPRLLAEEGGRLHGLARRICASAEEADDLVQEVFLRAWRHWEGFEGRAHPRTWLFTIAAHACQRMHRRRAGEPARMESLDADGPFAAETLGAVPAEGGLEGEVRREAREHLEAAIAGLPDDFRMPLVLKEIVGLSVAEVAGILGVVEATVKTRLHRARLKLRDALDEALPRVALPPPAYERQVCLDLLHAKQEALDRGVPFDRELVCERCRTVFAELDTAQDLCREMAAGELPAGVRRRVLDAVATAGGPDG